MVYGEVVEVEGGSEGEGSEGEGSEGEGSEGESAESQENLRNNKVVKIEKKSCFCCFLNKSRWVLKKVSWKVGGRKGRETLKKDGHEPLEEQGRETRKPGRGNLKKAGS